MAGPSKAPGPGEPEIERLLQEPAFRELVERGSPAFLASVGEGALVWANEAARRLLGAKLNALAARLIGGGTITNAAPRLQRLLIEGAKPLSFLTKRAVLQDGREILVAAVLGAAPAETAPEPQAEEPAGAADTAHTAEASDLPSAATEATATTAVMTAAELRANLLKSHPIPTVRFLWQTDEAGRVTSLTAPLAEIVGKENADLVGRDLAEIVETLQLDPSGKLLAALQVPETWSGIEVAWPVATAAAAVPVDLGGFPVFDPGRGFRGFRGFGVIHLDRIREAQPGEAGEEPPFAALEAAAPAMDRPAPSEPGGERAPVAPIEPAATARNVVPLRPYAALAAAFGLRSPAPGLPDPTASEPHANSTGRGLSENEHKAFDEIARALNEDATGAAEPDSADEPAAPPGPAADRLHAVAVLDRLPLGVLISRGATVLYANRTLLELAEYPSFEDLRAAGGLERLFERRSPADAANDAGTASIRTRDGNVVPVESKLQAISWEGQPASLITVRRASEGAHFASAQTLQLELQQREAELRELRAILDTATDGVAILDLDGRILSLNRSAEALFGYQQNEVAGEPFTMLIAEDSRRLVDHYFAKLKSGATSRIGDDRGEVRAIALGRPIPVFLTLGRIGGDDPPAKLCAVIRDMSAWKRAEHEAREARQEAERASAIKTDFLAKVSHEIRTPLNAIIGFAEVIMDERLGPIGTERYKDYLRDIHKSGTHVMSLVNDLLDLSKIEAGKMVLDIKSVDANATIAECVALMQPQANRERVIMRLALAPRLAQIAADERSVRQIVLNLLSNAVKYNEPGGQVIVSTAITETGHVAIRIKDTGIGMSEAELALALEPFRQVATARPVSGTGLGLPLTKALVEANRANFSIRSRKNEGTLVEVSFPPARVLAESA